MPLAVLQHQLQRGGKDKAYFVIKIALQDNSHVDTCGYQPCQVRRACELPWPRWPEAPLRCSSRSRPEPRKAIITTEATHVVIPVPTEAKGNWAPSIRRFYGRSAGGTLTGGVSTSVFQAFR